MGFAFRGSRVLQVVQARIRYGRNLYFWLSSIREFWQSCKLGFYGTWVDKERFVKLYLAGLKQAAGLSKAGLAVFEIVYKQLQDKPGQDTITLSILTCGMKKTAYYNGLREMLDKEFLYRSPLDGTFFVNIRFLFNGDRPAFVTGYRLKKTKVPKDMAFYQP